VVRLIAFVVLVGILGVTFLGVYFALHRKRVFTEIGDLEKAPPVHNTPA
jgi:hypothetical protein